MSKHTPGPWGLQRPIGSSYGILLPDGSGYIGEVYTWEENGAEEAKANALLIQHAPEMAEALEVFAAAADWDWDETIWRNVAPDEARILWSEQAKQGITRADLMKASTLLARIRGDAP